MKYDKMVERNRSVSREKVEIAQAGIKAMLAAGEAVTVAALVKITGLSREFFYKNTQVRSVLSSARARQSDMTFQRPRKAILAQAMEARLLSLEKQPKKEREEKEELLAINARLQKKGKT